ncbi:MAG: class I SAM-dependent methyltransferase [Acetobacteraceae bacterium]|nr:class I SAM-dependent methyltransferase [Acetobacteraceae bacterium]
MQDAPPPAEFDWTLLTPQSVLKLDDEAVEALFWTFHPRFRFFKTLPPEARLLDIGAGGGGLHFWREWGPPPRPDIALFGVDRQPGEHAARYAAWAAVDLDATLPDFAGERFDGFLMSHVVEHLADPARLLAWMATVAAPGARVYLEWPHPDTRRLPSADALRARGFDIQIFNFTDDATHLHAPSEAEIAGMLRATGFDVREAGRIEPGLLARELLARGVAQDVMAWRQMGLWGVAGWAAYAIAAVG